MGPRRLPSLALASEFGSLRTNTNYSSYWELHLALRSLVRNRFPTRVLQGVTCRWRQQKDILQLSSKDVEHG